MCSLRISLSLLIVHSISFSVRVGHVSLPLIYDLMLEAVAIFEWHETPLTNDLKCVETVTKALISLIRSTNHARVFRESWIVVLSDVFLLFVSMRLFSINPIIHSNIWVSLSPSFMIFSLLSPQWIPTVEIADNDSKVVVVVVACTWWLHLLHFPRHDLSAIRLLLSLSLPKSKPPAWAGNYSEPFPDKSSLDGEGAS